MFWMTLSTAFLYTCNVRFLINLHHSWACYTVHVHGFTRRHFRKPGKWKTTHDSDCATAEATSRHPWAQHTLHLDGGTHELVQLGARHLVVRPMEGENESGNAHPRKNTGVRETEHPFDFAGLIIGPVSECPDRLSPTWRFTHTLTAEALRYRRPQQELGH